MFTYRSDTITKICLNNPTSFSSGRYQGNSSQGNGRFQKARCHGDVDGNLIENQSPSCWLALDLTIFTYGSETVRTSACAHLMEHISHLGRRTLRPIAAIRSCVQRQYLASAERFTNHLRLG